MNIFKNEVTVDVHDIDPSGVARVSSLMKYIQSAAELQLSDIGRSYDELKSMKRAFILSKIKLEAYEPIRPYEKLSAETFPCPSRAYTFLRCYQLKRGGETVARAISSWALIDTENRSLVKVSDFELGLTEINPFELSVSRIVMPDSLTPLGEYRVTYADLDRNGHMNNTRYPDMYSNFLDLKGKRIDSISISFLNEARPGELISLFGAKLGDTVYIRSVREDGKLNSEAEIHITEI